MSHEIYTNDVVQLGSNKVAWHGIGKVWQGLLSPLRCFIEGTGARSMEQLNVYTASGLKVEGYKSIIGHYASGSTALSVVGDGYGLIDDERFFTILDKVYGGKACVETAGTLRNGRRIWSLVKRDTWCVAKDAINSYDLWVNRHDGSGCFELHRTNVRVVCQNTWNAAIGSNRNRVFGVRHTVNVDANVSQAIRLVEQVDLHNRQEQLKLQSLADQKISTLTANDVFCELLKIDPYVPVAEINTKTLNDLKALNTLFVRGTGNSGQTKWDAYNAVTEFVDHTRSIRVTDGRSRSESRFESVLLGSGDDLKARAFELLTN